MKLIDQKVNELFINPCGIPKLNSLIHIFPDISVSEFEEFILSNDYNSQLVNYILNEIYPTLKNLSLTHSTENLKKLSNLLNEISQDAQLALWKENEKSIYYWYKNSNNFLNYFSEITQERIINLIIYILYQSSKQSNSIAESKEKIRLATSLIIYLSDESIAIISNHEYFQILFQELNHYYSNEEMDVLIKVKPSIANLLNFNDLKTDLYYHATLFRSDQSDIASIQNLILSEYDTIRKKVKSKHFIEGSNFVSNQNGIFLKLEYLIELVKLFPEEKQLVFFDFIVKNPETSFLVREFDRDTIYSLINDKFRILQEIQKLKKSRILK
ncbi:MAG: hypothetical protein SFU98_13505 [Leptospiraceae bacterium]|nr:hypothetical protein [Leptospiraceae bacterium]